MDARWVFCHFDDLAHKRANALKVDNTKGAEDTPLSPIKMPIKENLVQFQMRKTKLTNGNNWISSRVVEIKIISFFKLFPFLTDAVTSLRRAQKQQEQQQKKI